MIRALTIGLPLGDLGTAEIADGVQRLLAVSAEAFSRLQISVRTTRFTLPALGLDGEPEGEVLSRLQWVDELARKTSTRWFCLPFNLLAPGPRQGRSFAAVDTISRFDRAFVNLILAENRTIAVDAVDDAARIVLAVSRKSTNGFDNFRVGASFNCPPNAPFFPFSRHEGSRVAFSLALETTPIALAALQKCDRPRDASALRQALIDALVPPLRAIDDAAKLLAERSETDYRGVDASFAPLPSGGVSVAELVERLIEAPIGSHGSVFATATLTDALREALVRSRVVTAGFNGVMYSLLEDAVLARANNTRRIDLDALLAMSTVCACGIDMVPVPGVAFPEEIGALMLDVAALSSALDKPLGVRLLPIPNAAVSDLTKLNQDFLCDSRVLGLTSNDRRVESTERPFRFLAPRVMSQDL
jgi:uncharacterized protein (UPF0210 family)